MTRVYFAQGPDVMPENTGIGRVVHAQHRHLPALGIEIVGSPGAADITVAHANAENLAELDVLHVHGLYWTGDPGSGQYAGYHHTINGRIAAECRRARAITVPSRWVAEPFLRDMRLRPDVIGHGIELDQWGPGESLGYALWNKNRPNDVCDPTPAFELARRGAPVVATFAPAGAALPPSLRVTGQLPHDEMKPMIQGAGVYLATTKETFGIGTLEALACGVPVLGYRHGATPDLIEHEVTGYLVAPGDLDGLVEGYAWLMARRQEISANCLAAAQRYGWRSVMERYAELYRRVAEEKRAEPRGVAVVITGYNYAQYIGEALGSVMEQTRRPEEIIIVNDGSTDNTRQVLAEALAPLAIFVGEGPDTYTIGGDDDGTPLITVINQDNQGVAAARNAGIAVATQAHIVCLDADDRLDPRFIATLLPVMQQNRGLGIAYTGLALLRGDELSYNEGWPPPFDWDVQTAPTVPAGNCIPSACMFRREMWKRAGGYQQVWAPGEDGELWTRGLGTGFEARQVTREPLFIYRLHEGSATRTKKYQRIDTWLPHMRDKQHPFAAPARKPPLVRSYSDPLVSVIVENDNELGWALYATLDSVVGQTFRNWELLSAGWGLVGKRHPYPFIRVNEEPRAPLALRVRAGQYLAPDYLETLIRSYAESGKLEGGLEMGCRTCGSQASPQQQAQRALVEQINRSVPTAEQATAAPGLVRMEFIGEQSGSVPFRSEDRQRIYYGGRRTARFADVDPRDVDWLLRYSPAQWQVVRRPEPPPEAPPEEVQPTVEGAIPYAAPEPEPETLPITLLPVKKRKAGGNADSVK